MTDQQPTDRAQSTRFVVPFAYRRNNPGGTKFRPEDAVEGEKYECISCTMPVHLKVSSKNNPYFWHKKNPNKKCSPESVRHALAIVALAEIINEHRTGIRPVRFEVKCQAAGCKRLAGLVALPVGWDSMRSNRAIRVDAYGKTLRPDLHLMRGDQVTLALEVCHTHPVDQMKAEASTYPWIELSASRVIDAHEKRQEEPLVVLNTSMGNVPPLGDPRCAACRIADRPVNPGGPKKPPAVKYERVQPHIKRKRLEIQKLFQDLQANRSSSVTVYGHRCDVCNKPKTYLITASHFDVVASPVNHDVHGTLDVALLKNREAGRPVPVYGFMVVSSNAYGGVHGQPHSRSDDGVWYVLVPFDGRPVSGGFVALTHSLPPEDFSCPECYDRKKAEDRRRQAEADEQQRIEDEKRSAERDRLKNKAITDEIEARVRRTLAEQMAEIARTTRERSPNRERLLFVLRAITEKRAQEEANLIEQLEQERSRQTAIDRIRIMLCDANRGLSQAISLVSFLPWKDFRGRLVAVVSLAEYQLALETMRSAYKESRRDMLEQEAATADIFAGVDPQIIGAFEEEDRVRRDLGYQIQRVLDASTMEAGKVAQEIKSQQDHWEKIEQFRKEIVTWIDMPSGDLYNFTDEEDRSRGQILGFLLSVSSHPHLPLWVKAMNKKTIAVGLLSDKTSCRRHLREIAMQAAREDHETGGA